MDKYKTLFLDCASKLDAITDGYGTITNCANDIVATQNPKSIWLLLNKISEISESEMFSDEVKEISKLLKEKLIAFFGYIKIREVCENDVNLTGNEKTFDELEDELNGLIGLNQVKTTVSNLINYYKIQQLRKENGFTVPVSTLHMAFIGNPGTGKTTVARIVGKMYKSIGLLSKGHFIEAGRTDLIAEYQGQTAIKVKKLINKAKGGVLFIDEAYSITENENSDSYGKECLTELTKALEDYRDDLVVIVAGYNEPMKKFFDSNPGLKSRFNTFIDFPDYNANELERILLSICKENDYSLEQDLSRKIKCYFDAEIENKIENFANGRLARNVFDKLIMNQANRIIKQNSISKNDLSELKECDY